MYSQSTSVHCASEAFPMMRYIIDVLLTYLLTYYSIFIYQCKILLLLFSEINYG